MSKKKFISCLCLIFVSALIFFGVMTDNKISSATAIGEIRVNGYLNVRKGPGKKYGFVKSGGAKITLGDGKRVTIIAKNGKWYHVKFKMTKETITGYIHSSYVKVQTGKVRTSISGTIKKSGQQLHTKADINSKLTKVDGKDVKLVKGTALKILSEKVNKNQKWYYVSFKQGNAKCKGYLQATSVKVDYKKGMPAKINSTNTIKLSKDAGKPGSVSVEGKIVKLKKNQQVTAIAEKEVSGIRYYKIQVREGSKTVKGFVAEKNLLFQIVKTEEPGVVPKVTAKPTAKPTATPKKTATPKQTTTTTTTDSQFKKNLQNQGFPSSYITPLMNLHKQYPNWEFKAFQTGVNWSDAVAAESKVGLNLLSNSKSYDWKSTAAGAYDWTTDKFVVFDGSTWVTASEKAVKYYMDPRNFLDDTGIFQFESLEYQSAVQTQAGVENVLKNTPMYKKSFTYTNDNNKSVSIKYSKAFMEAAVASKVSPYHLASRSKQEVVISSTMMSSSVSGNVEGYKGIYNFYNIGANSGSNAVKKGLKWASTGTDYSRPWTNPYRSIYGGACYIGKQYINAGQNTLYLQKFNVTSTNRYNHQYMANIEAPNSEATKTAAAYGADKDNTPIVFSIPVYNNMPSSACPMPQGGANPNNYLKNLYVKDHAFSEPFKLGDTGSKTYQVTVANSVSKVKIVATAVSSSATVTGAGDKALSVGTNTITVKVKSASGTTRSYKIKIVRKDSATAKKAAKQSSAGANDTSEAD
ncbi:MAG: cadherin-like beta sandwich domain-containing protein [Lachnospiraceae bacterium]|nr:cadherin-like beta sandwich domain-containing protein [Lachnospiraceae bacterium]